MSFAETAGAALLRAVDGLAAPDAAALERVRVLARSLQAACAYYETRAATPAGPPSVPAVPAVPPAPAVPGLPDYRRIADAGGDRFLVARLLHADGAGLVDRLRVLRALYGLSLEDARAADDGALAAPGD